MTLRKFLWMAEARRDEAWEHTATLQAAIFNAMGVGERLWSSKDFHPLRQPEKPLPPPPVPITALKIFL